MTAYWILFGLWAVGAIQFSRQRAEAYGSPLFVVATAYTALMIGLRDAVGGDWGTYIGMYQDIMFQPFAVALRQSDPGYGFLNWIASRDDWGIWVVNLGCGTLFMAGLARLAWRQPNPWLAILVAVPYFVIVVAMGYTRQAAAIGIICWALGDASGSIWRKVILVGVAALFHRTAILVLPILLAPSATRTPLIAIIGAVIFAGLAVFFLGGESDRLLANYVTSNYDSQGAAVRVTMNVVAAGLLIIFRKRMAFDDVSGSIWAIFAILSVISVAGLFLTSASSGVDRLSLYLIPLQVVVFSRLPYAFSPTERPVPSVLLTIVGYSFAVQFVWLNYADNANSWIPYRAVFM